MGPPAGIGAKSNLQTRFLDPQKTGHHSMVNRQVFLAPRPAKWCIRVFSHFTHGSGGNQGGNEISTRGA